MLGLLAFAIVSNAVANEPIAFFCRVGVESGNRPEEVRVFGSGREIWASRRVEADGVVGIKTTRVIRLFQT